MASQKQLAANRRNAQKSTGPRTAEGKSNSRLNAKRDGFTGQVITLSAEDLPIFEKLKSELIADLAPKTVMELKLAHSIAWDTWRLDHLRAVEMNLYALGADDPATAVDCNHPELETAMCGARTFARESHQFALMSLYEQRLNRGIHKNLATLRDMQAERRRAYERDREEEITLAKFSEIKELPYAAPNAPSANGFVFSNDEVRAAANRESTLHMARQTVRGTPLKVYFAGAGASSAPATESTTAILDDFPHKTAPGTSRTSLSTGPATGANPAFLSR